MGVRSQPSFRGARFVLTLAAAASLSACAHGVPVGSRRASFDGEFRPLTQPSAPRSAPEQVIAQVVTRKFDPPGDGRERVVEMARSLIGKKAVKLNRHSYPSDCTGLVSGVFDQIGLPVMASARSGDNGVSAIYRFTQQHGRIFKDREPAPGDLVFFRETYDLNRDGRSNDGLTHVGIVEAVMQDGTVKVIHRVERGVVRYRMNLRKPTVRVDPWTGVAVNDFLRTPGSGEKLVLTGQLFAAYGSLLPAVPPKPAAVALHKSAW